MTTSEEWTTTTAVAPPPRPRAARVIAITPQDRRESRARDVVAKVIVITVFALLAWTVWRGTPAATAQVVDPTGSNPAIWGSPSFNRQMGPDDVVVQVAAARIATDTLIADGSVAYWGTLVSVPARLGTPTDPAIQVATGGSHLASLLADGSVAC